MCSSSTLLNAMVSVLNTSGISSSCLSSFLEKLPRSRFSFSTVSCASKVKNGSVLGSSSVTGSKVIEDDKLEVMWDDRYGNETVKEYLDYAQDIIRPDGGPPRWFTPISCGPHLKDSPVLLFLPGPDGTGLGLSLHHKALGKVFDVRCMHVPVQDRTPFHELVEWVEETVNAEHSLSPNKPIYLVGESFGGCLALSVAARNPKVDLVVILVNPATSFSRSPLQPLLPLLEALPDNLHVTVPYLQGLIMGDPVKMAAVGIDASHPPTQYFENLVSNLSALLPRVSGMAEILPKDTLLWKLKLLKTGAAYANSRLHAVRATVLILASGKDNLLPSRDESRRLMRSLKTCRVRDFKDNGHTILLEDGVNLLTIIKATCTYRRSRIHDHVKDFLPPSASEFKQVERNGLFRNYVGLAMFSTKEDGHIVRGLSGIPDEGPVLLVGYHMLTGLEAVFLIIEQFLLEKKIMLRSLGHRAFFFEPVENQTKPRRGLLSKATADQVNDFSIVDYMRLYGVLPVSGSYLLKSIASESHVALYPGGLREALHRKGEEYKLFWPEQPEFVRTAAKFGATIVPFGVVGIDDLAELVLDYNDLMRIPFVSDQIKRENEEYKSLNIRAGMSGEVADQRIHIPGLLPKVPGRYYYLFGKPIPTKGRKEELNNKEKAKELYMRIQDDIESSMSYLLKKRNEDPYRSLIDRITYQVSHDNAPVDQVPSFEP